jgi:hypothetical protein
MGGTAVTITGSGFFGADQVNVGATAVTNAPCTGSNAPCFTVNSDTSVTAISPAQSAGIVDITVHTAGGTSPTNAGNPGDSFDYAAAPTVTSITPTNGAAAGGTMITVTGTNFEDPSASHLFTTTRVSFGATDVTVAPCSGGSPPANAPCFTVNSASSITVWTPAHGVGQADTTVTTPGGTSGISAGDVFTYNAPPQGYWLVAGDGGVFPYGPAAAGYGSAYGHTNSPIVGVAAAPDGHGYWMALQDGGVFPEGPSAAGYGSAFGVVKEPVIGIAAVPGGGGYYLYTGSGGVFPFGPRAYGFGSAFGKAATPITGMAVAPDGNGYWMLAQDGGIFPFGPSSAGYGSAYGLTGGSPAVGITANPQGGGYWIVTANGGLFPFGPNAPGFGSAFGITTAPVVGITASADGGGFWITSSDGNVYAFGDSAQLGNTKGVSLFKPIVGIASVG